MEPELQISYLNKTSFEWELTKEIITDCDSESMVEKKHKIKYIYIHWNHGWKWNYLLNLSMRNKYSIKLLKSIFNIHVKDA